MHVIVDNLPAIWGAFRLTLTLTLLSGAIALVGGTVIAAMRVSPLAPLRALGASYVEIVRNTPLTLVFAFWVFVMPQLGIVFPLGFVPAVVALSVYTSAFVAEAVRSGINSVAVGQAEAARAIGLTFGGTLRLVVLPQAVRTVIPPLINVLIALTKNTSVAAGFATTELVALSRRLANVYPADVIPAFVGIGLFFLAITIPLGILANVVERKVAFTR